MVQFWPHARSLHHTPIQRPRYVQMRAWSCHSQQRNRDVNLVIRLLTFFLPSDTQELRITLTRTNLRDDDEPAIAWAPPRWLPSSSRSHHSPALHLHRPRCQFRSGTVRTNVTYCILYQMSRLDFKKNLPPARRTTAARHPPQVLSYQILKDVACAVKRFGSISCTSRLQPTVGWVVPIKGSQTRRMPWHRHPADDSWAGNPCHLCPCHPFRLLPGSEPGR
jgi:hypothetical protein